ncbi:hypothetical protein KP509_16G046600 [Ceratopteris richardii]|uniref:Uncharacterized protein n=1 Tax=Ceratopteris richardii TaxID=49495 RepID=A0A8T2SZA6_CERRI|nr:hypothetical protein KP509_16G046600 [Ceratopteris richardii]KAH7387881.1 hypothetical protein KP509_16G046600 [Ceratopteris richardii]KAH7387882.1 hypothetical protein KP509_16G046600 [Ceratopteris richardii]KAH7387883.1 hypothetical protein KP509_16G046600 [Ceratopteris richardii]
MLSVKNPELRLPPCSSTSISPASRSHRHLIERNIRPFRRCRPQIAISASSAPGECRFFATCAPGLEEVVAAELSSPLIAASEITPGSSGVAFTGSFRTAYNANLWLRCAVRVLVELASGPVPRSRTNRRSDPIYDFVREYVDWQTLLVKDDLNEDCGYNPDTVHAYNDKFISSSHVRSPASRSSVSSAIHPSLSRGSPWRFRTFAVQARTRDCPQVNNSMFASIRAKDAICDSIRYSCGGAKPSPPEDGGAAADVPLFLSIFRDTISLYRDMSGISLHRRGYRDAMHRASLNEAIAAGCLTIAGWNEDIAGFGGANSGRMKSNLSLLDPMCGSGTFLIEAALMACKHAPGLHRQRWPFHTWHDFNHTLWKECWDGAASARRTPPKGLTLMGNDIHEGALSLCMRDAATAGVDDLLDLSCKPCEDYAPHMKPSLVLVNPPWGARLGMSRADEPENVFPVWQGLGQFLKEQCNNADVYVLSGSSSATRGLRMKCDRKWPIVVGGIECKLLHYYVLPPKSYVNPTAAVEVAA